MIGCDEGSLGPLRSNRGLAVSPVHVCVPSCELAERAMEGGRGRRTAEASRARRAKLRQRNCLRTLTTDCTQPKLTLLWSCKVNSGRNVHDRRETRERSNTNQTTQRDPNSNPHASLLGLPTYSTTTPTPLRLRVLLDPKGTPDELGRKVYRGAFEHLH